MPQLLYPWEKSISYVLDMMVYTLAKKEILFPYCYYIPGCPFPNLTTVMSYIGPFLVSSCFKFLFLLSFIPEIVQLYWPLSNRHYCCWCIIWQQGRFYFIALSAYGLFYSKPMLVICIKWLYFVCRCMFEWKMFVTVRNRCYKCSKSCNIWHLQDQRVATYRNFPDIR
jgi:hypothetical protein